MKLLELQAELESVAETGRDSAAVVELDQSKVGRLSRMDAMQGRAMAEEAGRRRNEMFARIAAALKRIDEAEYGDCAACGEPIHPKRLEFDPTVLLCIDCATKREP